MVLLHCSFKRVPVGLAGSRSISEDSIFKPEQTKEQPIGVLHGTAVSMERINSDFQVRVVYMSV